jgi:hypothetical protein
VAYQVAGVNRRCRGSRRESAVAQLGSLGVMRIRLHFFLGTCFGGSSYSVARHTLLRITATRLDGHITLRVASEKVG